MNDAKQHYRNLIRNCPLCGHKMGKVIGDLHIEMFEDCPVDGDFFLVACEQCGFTFHDIDASQDDFDAYYQQNEFNYSASDKTDSYQFPNDAVRYGCLAKRIIPYLDSKSVIFDIGCAKGGFLESMRAMGFSRLFGVDPFPLCVEHIKHTLGLSAEVGTATQLPFTDVQADALIYSHIVEHVFDLHHLIDAASKKLSENGIIYVEVPDASRYGEYKNPPFCHFMFEHINHFDLSALVQLFGNSGFKVADAGCDHTGFVTTWPVAWAIFTRGESTGSAERIDNESSLRKYLAWSKHHPLIDILHKLADKQTPVYIWGVWQYARQLIGLSPLGQCNLVGLVDKDIHKQGRVLKGLSIQSPSKFFRNASPDSAVIVTATNHQQEILKSLFDQGYRGKIISLDGEEILYEQSMHYCSG